MRTSNPIRNTRKDDMRLACLYGVIPGGVISIVLLVPLLLQLHSGFDLSPIIISIIGAPTLTVLATYITLRAFDDETPPRRNRR